MPIPDNTNAPVVGTGASRRVAEAGPVCTEERAPARYLQPAPAATVRLVAYTSVRTDVFGRRRVLAVVLPVRIGETPPGPTVSYRGHTWTCAGETPMASATLAP